MRTQGVTKMQTQKRITLRKKASQVVDNYRHLVDLLSIKGINPTMLEQARHWTRISIAILKTELEDIEKATLNIKINADTV